MELFLLRIAPPDDPGSRPSLMHIKTAPVGASGGAVLAFSDRGLAERYNAHIVGGRCDVVSAGECPETLEPGFQTNPVCVFSSSEQLRALYEGPDHFPYHKYITPFARLQPRSPFAKLRAALHRIFVT